MQSTCWLRRWNPTKVGCKILYFIFPRNSDRAQSGPCHGSIISPISNFFLKCVGPWVMPDFFPGSLQGSQNPVPNFRKQKIEQHLGLYCVSFEEFSSLAGLDFSETDQIPRRGLSQPKLQPSFGFIFLYRRGPWCEPIFGLAIWTISVVAKGQWEKGEVLKLPKF